MAGASPLGGRASRVDPRCAEPPRVCDWLCSSAGPTCPLRPPPKRLRRSSRPQPSQRIYQAVVPGWDSEVSTAVAPNFTLTPNGKTLERLAFETGVRE